MSESESFADRFWNVVCAYQSLLFVLLGVEAVLLVLLGFSAWVGPPNPASNAILVLDVVVVGLGFVGSAYALFRCRRRQAARRGYELDP
ncbi:hypothetical protein [Halococcus sp. IIIV-5B]|uniref:hypothetical protein n=1 Tax=Halococcus sp. IIIV-5B TaxID=2321230 RepID=UPI000E76FFF4|nr:hypothetical protein [Halococcus sp. IIIV-5B]RJT00188.1 hypothetical protein D3261_15375 [Halococcus sp. IIIV-5B]